MKGGWDNSPLPNLPAISGGIWNNKGGSGYLAGRNCVTNEVYWLLSYFLSVAQNDKKYIDPYTDVAAWFSQAKTQGVLFDSGGLVIERFKGTEDSRYKDHNMDGYTWIGDQALFLRCCMHVTSPNVSNLNREQSAATISAVLSQKTSNKVLSEALCPDSDFCLDYAGGKGIFMRHLGALNNDNHQSPPPLSGITYDDQIKANASAVWNHKLPNGNFHYWWEKPEDEAIDWGYPPDVVANVLHASGLSALTACIPYMAGEEVGT
jgi:hypothetical protein